MQSNGYYQPLTSLNKRFLSSFEVILRIIKIKCNVEAMLKLLHERSKWPFDVEQIKKDSINWVFYLMNVPKKSSLFVPTPMILSTISLYVSFDLDFC